MILIYDKPNTHSVPLKSGMLTFMPGVNRITQEKLTEYEKEYKFDKEAMFENGIMKIMVKDESTFTIKKLSEFNAIELIENTMDVKELETYLKEESKVDKEKKIAPRKAVMLAIEKQIAELSVTIEDKENGKK